MQFGPFHLSLLLAFTLLPSLSAQEKEILGTLRSLDLDVGTLSISREPKGQVKTFSLLKKETPVANSAGAPAKLSDLKKNDRVVLSVVNDEDVVSIRVESDLDWGVVTGVDVAAKEVVAHMGNIPRPFQITDKFRLSIDGKPGTAADLGEVRLWSHGLKVQLTPDRSGVQEMWISRAKYHSNPYCRRVGVTGFLTRHDPVKKNVTLVSMDRYETMEFEYDSWTQLRLIHSFHPLGDLPIDQLKTPAKASIGYDSDTRRIATIGLEAATLRRIVASLDMETRKLSLEAMDDQPAETFVVAPRVRVVRDGKEPRTLADVKEKYVVTVGLSPDQKEVWYVSYGER